MSNSNLNYPKVVQPKKFKVKLYDHQLTAIYMMEERERLKSIKVTQNSILETSIGVFADITGYGKTASIIGMLIRDKMEWDLNKTFTT